MPAPKHILIIDDEEDIRDILSTALTMAGYRVSQAAAAITAKKIVAADQPDLIITDLQLENSDGLTLIEEIKTKLPGVPTLLLTGVLFDEKAVEEQIRKKVSAYLVKTAPLSAVLAEVGRLLGSQG